MVSPFLNLKLIMRALHKKSAKCHTEHLKHTVVCPLISCHSSQKIYDISHIYDKSGHEKKGHTTVNAKQARSKNGAVPGSLYRNRNSTGA